MCGCKGVRKLYSYNSLDGAHHDAVHMCNELMNGLELNASYIVHTWAMGKSRYSLHVIVNPTVEKKYEALN